MHFNRRTLLKLGGIAGINTLIPSFPIFSMQNNQIMTRSIPSSGEQLPIVGIGTYQTFDVGDDRVERGTLIEVLHELHRLGGAMIDSSPMYASSEKVVGDLTVNLDFKDSFFYATKVWTTGKDSGIKQMNKSFSLMQRESMDLMQIHNLQDWETHLKTLRTWKEEGKIRYWGITHYVDSAHPRLERIIKDERPDFVQFNYSILSRNAEKSLFNTAEKYGTATIINMPFDSGNLFPKVRGKALPPWAADYDINSWGQFFLKFILSQPQVTCVIPGTSKPHHAIDNMGAGYGKLPDQNGREKMVRYLEGI